MSILRDTAIRFRGIYPNAAVVKVVTPTSATKNVGRLHAVQKSLKYQVPVPLALWFIIPRPLRYRAIVYAP